MIPLRPLIERPLFRAEPPCVDGRRMSLASLCRQAGVELRATVPPRQIVIYYGRQSVRTPRVDVVGVPAKDLHGRTAALRALETLAHGFHDHGARACVCRPGIFSTNVRHPKLD